MNLPRILLLTGLLLTTTGLRAEKAATPAETLIARGRYLVEGVGLCADCHTPRNERGEFVLAHWLRGAPIGFAPTVPMPAWAVAAPPIAGLPSLPTDDAVRFLMEGKRPDGTMPRPPMPSYRLNEADARAMVAYLKSLGDTPAAVAAPAH
jgi:mono/diheme cytochrome c family protein